VIIDGSYLVDGPPELVSELLHDIQALQQMLPGCEQIYRLEPDTYHVVLNIPNGPFHGRYDGIVTPINDLRGEQFGISFSGSGAEHIVSGKGIITLAAEEGGSRLTYEGEVDAVGVIAATAPRLVRTTTNYLIRSFLEALNEQVYRSIGGPSDPDLSTAAGSSAAPGPQTIDMQGFLAELRRDRRVAGFVLLAAIVGIFSVLGVVFAVLLAARRVARIRAERGARSVVEESRAVLLERPD